MYDRREVYYPDDSGISIYNALQCAVIRYIITESILFLPTHIFHFILYCFISARIDSFIRGNEHKQINNYCQNAKLKAILLIRYFTFWFNYRKLLYSILNLWFRNFCLFSKYLFYLRRIWKYL